MSTAYERVMARQRQTQILAGVSGLLGWDQETMMPKGAADQRAEQMGAMEELLHARRSDPALADGLAEAESADLDEVSRANLREIRRQVDHATKVPADLAAELARVTSRAQGVWAAARAADDVAAFTPMLEQIVALKRDEAAALSDGSAYDALLDQFEPGATGADLAAMFGALRPRLVALRDRIFGAEQHPEPLMGTFAEDTQIALARDVAERYGYDFERGRIDKAVHPFSSGSGSDVRITTRTDPADPFNCLYSTIHEVGHGCYEQGVDPAYAFTPLGHGASMGVHESQSRIYENQLGRSRAFTGWLHGRMTDLFGDLGMDADGFFGTVNRLQKGFIRTEADEVQYNLHVLLRFDLERELIDGSLTVAELEGAWNDRFEADFGYRPDRPSQGCLQDVHWSVGLFGYFPTYTLGNVYAGCLNEALRRDVPDLDSALADGDPSPATDWLREKLQRHGSLRTPRETIIHAIGGAPSEEPLLSYLEAKFGEIYGF
ncbi:carboxypeptidase M32 [Palleronia caenipelagi]|uniref:Metal-dependent carboxypeptidase n=1 Tax=Palleronia caenipelagi TaxID=2489174 RepID=A0A547Q657_9RHOB|nr:carboxypeptidase M32 [Palleronia caenipelagi]TRD21868.1 carboxypeptidase M32 [Palleronia caenipelagi]